MTTETERIFTKSTRARFMNLGGGPVTFNDPVLVFKDNCYYIPEEAMDLILALEACAVALPKLLEDFATGSICGEHGDPETHDSVHDSRAAIARLNALRGEGGNA